MALGPAFSFQGESPNSKRKSRSLFGDNGHPIKKIRHASQYKSVFLSFYRWQPKLSEDFWPPQPIPGHFDEVRMAEIEKEFSKTNPGGLQRVLC
jgi:hypothetical protein